MRNIMILNPKGGSGKSSIATNLAGYCVKYQQRVILADLDPQQSATDWLKVRSPQLALIEGGVTDLTALKTQTEAGIRVIDTPAAIPTEQLKEYLKRAHTVLVPVLPSALDIRAAARLIQTLLAARAVVKERTRIAVIANRVRYQTRGYAALQRFLTPLGVPVVATLRDSQCYVRAAESGQSIFDLTAHEAREEWREWRPLIEWLGDPASLPLAERP